MPVMFTITVITSLLAAILGALIVLKIHHGYLNKIQVRNQGWERAQEAHQHNWEIKQEKHAAELEMRLTWQVQQVQRAWEEWEAKDQHRLKTLTKQYEDAVAQLHMEHELARLRRTEDAPLILDAMHQHQYILPSWQPPMLQGSNLSEHDLSHRFLGHADLRNAQLANTNFYMADLSGAFLTGANLTGADLSGANLAGADLRGATLIGANLLVADLHSVILVGANLLGVRNLTRQQISSAIYDSTTQLDAELNITWPSIPDLQPAMPVSPTETTGTANSSHIMSRATTVPANESAFVSPPETPLPPLLNGETESLIPPQVESHLSSPPPSSESLPSPAHNGKKRVKAR